MHILGYFMGVGALGLVIGYLIALSASPVIGALLPLLFSLLGGAGAIYATKLDLRDPQERDKLNVAGWSLACFALAILMSSALAIKYRDRVPPLPLTATNHQTPAQIEHAVQLAKLRRQLQMLGTTDDEIARILRTAPALTVSAVDGPARMAEKANKIATAAGLINKRVNAVNIADADLKQKIENWKAAMAFVEKALPEAAQQLRTDPEIASRVLGFQLDYLTHMTKQLTGGKDTAVWNVSDYEKLGYDTGLLGALLETVAVLDAFRIHFSDQTTSATFFKDDASTKLERQASPLRSNPAGWFAYHQTPFNFPN